MTKCLTIDEMLDVLSEINHPAFSTLRGMAEAIADKCAEAIKELVPVETGKASYEGAALAGTCATFWTAEPGTPCPEPLRYFDSEEWTDAEGNNLDPKTGAPL